MKIAFCIRQDYKTRGGGDVVQMLKTKESLEKQFDNINIEIINDSKLLDNSFDLCHIFNYSTHIESRLFFEKAKQLNCKIASSPIYWDYRVLAYGLFCKLGINSISRKKLKLEILISKTVNFFIPVAYLYSKKFKSEAKYFIDNSDVILPNSEEELDLLCDFVKYDKAKLNYKVVYNAAEIIEVDNEIDVILNINNIPENYVLQVGRIEPVKNQYKLIEALFYDNDIPILFIGSSAHREYFISVKELAQKRGNVFFLNEIEHKKIYGFYKRAKCHILPSLRESPGLVSLESIAMECKTIVSKYPYSPFETYFADYAKQIDPLCNKSIRDSIVSLKDEDFFKEKYDNKFNWSVSGLQTYEAYNQM